SRARYRHDACSSTLMGGISIAGQWRAGFPVIPMGYPTIGSWFSGDFSLFVSSLAADRAPARAIHGGDLAVPISAVPADVHVGRRQAGQRRPNMEQSHGAQLSLLDAAAADTARMVCGATANVDKAALNVGHVRY